MRILWILGLSVFVFGSLSAQNDTNFVQKLIAKRAAKRAEKAEKFDAYRISGANLGASLIQDQKMSPIVYRGFGIGANLSHVEFRTKWMDELNASFQFFAATHNENSATMQNFYGRADYTLFRMNGKTDNTFMYGAALSNLVNFKNYPFLGNNAFNMDYALMINPAIRYQLNRKILGRRSIFFTELQVSGAGLMLRNPEYTFTGINAFFSHPGKYINAKWRICWAPTYKFTPENHFSISYSLDYYRLSEYSGLFKVRNAVQSISISYWLKTY